MQREWAQKCTKCDNNVKDLDNLDELENFKRSYESDKRTPKESRGFRDINIYDLNISLFQALCQPALYRHIRLPAPFYIPTFTFQQKTSFNVNLNSNGCCWISINMGQYLDASASGSQNGTSTCPNSNIFMTSSTYSALTGTTAIPSADAIPANLLGLNVIQMPTGNFNAIRCGPMSIEYTYTGRLDNSSGIVSAGINYTNISAVPGTGTSTTIENGLLPDISYSTLSLIEDCPFNRTVPITDSLKCIYVPQDYSILNLKSPLDSNNTVIAQRLFILIAGGPVSQIGVARITVTANWEGVPSKTTQDWVTPSVSSYPPNYNGQEIFNYMMKNNLVITKEDDEFGITKFAQTVKAGLS